jgi:hypothetical protein
MKTTNFKFLAILLLFTGFTSGCGEDEDKTSIFVGNYVITEAKISEAFTVPITGMAIDFPVPAGTNITTAIQTALLGSVTCSSADKTYIEIRKDFSLYLSCELANELNAGTWTEVSSTQLSLNLNSTAVPSAPTGVSLQVTDVTKSGGILNGKTSVPLPKALVGAMITALNPDWTLDADAPDIFIVKFSLKLTQK